jgi:hypothetical protein
MSGGRNAETGVVGFKIEAVENVAEVIAAVDCGLLVEEPEFTLEPKMNPRKPARPYMGGIKQVPGGKSCTMKFKAEIKGSGTAGTAPEWGGLLLRIERGGRAFDIRSYIGRIVHSNRDHQALQGWALSDNAGRTRNRILRG